MERQLVRRLFLGSWLLVLEILMTMGGCSAVGLALQTTVAAVQDGFACRVKALVAPALAAIDAALDLVFTRCWNTLWTGACGLVLLL